MELTHLVHAASLIALKNTLLVYPDAFGQALGLECFCRPSNIISVLPLFPGSERKRLKAQEANYDITTSI
jgi:hypothetical protein